MGANPFHVPPISPASDEGPLSQPPMNFQSRRMRLNSARRYAVNHLVTGLALLSTLLVIAPLVAILVYLIYKGASSLNLAFFTHIPAPVGEEGGGMANAILGSGIVLGLASLMGFRWGLRPGYISRSLAGVDCSRVRSGLPRTC